MMPIAECSAETMGTPNIHCCDDGTDCHCARIECEDSGDFCHCNFASEGAGSCTRTYCCNVPEGGQCDCSSYPCTGDDIPVPECSVSILECNKDEQHVEKCSPR